MYKRILALTAALTLAALAVLASRSPVIADPLADWRQYWPGQPAAPCTNAVMFYIPDCVTYCSIQPAAGRVVLIGLTTGYGVIRRVSLVFRPGMTLGELALALGRPRVQRYGAYAVARWETASAHGRTGFRSLFSDVAFVSLSS